jgi:ribosomal protein S12 methylthiotransferase
VTSDGAASRVIGGTAYILSMGCSKNTVDSERFAAVLRGEGFVMASRAEGAEVCLVNTCGFLREAVEENIAAILDLAEMKSRGIVGRIAVVGCLVGRYGADLGRDIPEVDFWGDCEDYASLLRALSPGACDLPRPGRGALPGGPSHVRYLKLAEGCDNRCSYCTIPSIRGGLRSAPIASLVGEAEALVTEGASEICLVAQDLTAYGRDLGGGVTLTGLIDALESSLPPDLWLRLLYLQPSGIDSGLLERVAGGRQVLPYLDMPIQHSSPEVLAAMNRASDSGKILEIFRTARQIRQDFALRTTVMVGFPGETRRDFDGLLRFLDEARADRVGAFAFSPEEGTPAASMPRQVPRRTKMARLERLMAHQDGISLSRGELFVGSELDVLVDRETEPGTAEGRSFRDAPEVDGVVEVRGVPPDLGPGDRIRALVTDAYEHDMIASHLTGGASHG